MICIYHNKDLDGYCSAAIVKLKYPDAILIGYDYGQTLKFEQGGQPIILGGPIIMVDVSMPMDKMKELADLSNYQLTWIDHHASAIKDYMAYVSEHGQFCYAILEDGISACEGTWKYLFPDADMPDAVKLLGEYDTWRNKDVERWEKFILPFQYGMRMECNSPESFPFFFLESEIDFMQSMSYASVIKNGNMILRYQKEQNIRACKASFELNFAGYRAICLNAGGVSSLIFESVYDEEKHDIMIPFFFDGRHWKFSLYTTKDEIDCSVIAKKRGGGGHKKASGFILDYLPEDFRVI